MLSWVRRMARFEFVVLLLIKCANCAFFDLTDIDDPISLLWQSKEPLVKQTTTACRGTASVAVGQCRHKTLCLLSGGQATSDVNCGNFLTCCTTSAPKCSQSTKSKISYFSGDSTFLGNDCEYKVHVQKNVCQIRLDFEQFQLAHSEQETVRVDTAYRRICKDDYMTVTPSVNNVPQFCGNNKDQHVYIHLNAHRVVTLTVHLVKRIEGVAATVRNPNWKIRITQLECPVEYDIFSKHTTFDSAGKDFPLLAPPGAAQYFTEPIGRIRSFGYVDGQSEYISGLFYTIAFKRPPYVNCIRFTTKYLRIRPEELTTPSTCHDYLFIPEFSSTETVVPPLVALESKVCSPRNAIVEFDSHPPGPFYIHFRSMPTYSDYRDISVGQAFDIQYELTSCGVLI